MKDKVPSSIVGARRSAQPSDRMIQRIVLVIAFYAACLPAWADASLVQGRAISQFDDVEIRSTPEETCPPDAICLRGWSRWTLEIEQTIAGPKVPIGRTHIVMMQHAPVVDSTFKKQLLFVLEHIDDPAERKRLHADYKMLDMPAPETMICTRIDPRHLGLAQEEIYRHNDAEDTSFCFRDPTIARE